MQPSAAHYSSSGSGSEGSDIDWEPEQDTSLESSTQALTQREAEEGQGGEEGVFSRFRNYAGSFRIKLSNKDRKKLEELESEERYDLIRCINMYILLSCMVCCMTTAV